jgi:hypothetical protein
VDIRATERVRFSSTPAAITDAANAAAGEGEIRMLIHFFEMAFGNYTGSP